MPTFPLLSIWKTVVVAKAEVEELTVKSGTVPPGEPETENLPQGVVVPTPSLPDTETWSVDASPRVVLSWTVKFPAMVVTPCEVEPERTRLLP